MRTQVLKAGPQPDVKTVPAPMGEINMQRIQDETVLLATMRTNLRDLITACEAELDTVKAKHKPALIKGVAEVKAQHDLLFRLIDSEAGRALFAKPKTRTFDAMKVGLRQAQGKVSWAKGTADKVVAKIKKTFGELAGDYLHTKEVPDKEALEKLSAKELKPLGIDVVAAGDVVVIKDTVDETSKLVDALLNGDKGEEDGEE